MSCCKYVDDCLVVSEKAESILRDEIGKYWNLKESSIGKPKIFALFPQAVAITNEFVLSRLDHVTSEMLRCELIAKIIPALEEEAAKEKVPEEYDYISGLVEKPPSKPTVLR